MKRQKSNQFYIFAISLLFCLMEIFLLPKTANLAEINSQTIVNLTNEERQKAGAKPLIINQSLNEAAYQKGRAIFTYQLFQHNFSDRKFSSWIKDAGYNYNYVGENLAIDFATNEGIVTAWLKSPSHRKNLLNENFSDIGVAVLEGSFRGQNTTLVVQIFGSPMVDSYLTISNNNLLAANYYSLPATNFLTASTLSKDLQDQKTFANEYYDNNFLNLNQLFYYFNSHNQPNNYEALDVANINYSLIFISLTIIVSLFFFLYSFDRLFAKLIKNKNKLILSLLK